MVEQKGASFLVGIDKYNDENLPDFKHSSSAREVQAIKQLLSRHESKYERPQPEFELTHEVTCQDLVTKLKKFLSIKEYRDKLIYFSGHGYQYLEEDDNDYKGYFVTSDSYILIDHNNNGKLDKLSKGLSYKKLAHLISEAKDLRSLVLLIDACHSGDAIKTDALPEALLKLNFDSRNRAEPEIFKYCIICSSLWSEESSIQDSMGVFTQALIKVLGNQEAGSITAEGLVTRIKENLNSNHQQTIKSYSAGHIMLMNYPSVGCGESAPEPIYTDPDTKELKNPYQGLEAFDENSSVFFYGQDALVSKLIDCLEGSNEPKKTNFVPIIGASGSGKSSVVLAGLVPRLEELGWQVLDPLKPGFKPLERLEEVLRKNYFSYEEELLDKCIHDESSEGLKPLLESFPQGRHLLLIDQFEELFTVAQEKQRDRFIQLITQVAELPNSPLAIVTTMRADFLEPCLRYESLNTLIEGNLKLMPTLTGNNLIDAICEPAKRQGYEVTEELLNKIIEDVKQEPGFLPLLEFALTQLWEERDEEKHQLTLQGYEAVGGMVGALNDHAEKVYQYKDYEECSPNKERDEAEKGLIKLIFLKLLQIGEGQKDTRVRQLKAKILSLAGDNLKEQKTLKELIDGRQGLVKGRLLVTGGSEQEEEAWVDLAHEALIEGWEQLDEWRNENREGRRLAAQVTKDAQIWQANKKSPDFLWGGYKLAGAGKVLSEYAAIEPLSELTKEFLKECKKQELRSYLLNPDVDSLDQVKLEKEAAEKSFLSRDLLKIFQENENEEAKVRLAASWVLKQWGEEVPMWLAEIDEEEKISLRIVEPPPAVVEDLGNGISLEMVEIPDGEFWMGAPEKEGLYSDQCPQHKVMVSSFLMGKYPVTQAQWRAIASLPKVQQNLQPNPSLFKGDNHPVERVTWYDAVEFCQRLSKKTKRKYRLPSEAEWEYACRAGTTTDFHFGKMILSDLANYAAAARGRTTPSGRFQVANAFGLYDMHGNVWEWCEDHWHDSYHGAPTNGDSWLDNNDNENRIQRGGSCYSAPWYCHSANRIKPHAASRNNMHGLRVVVNQ